MRGYEKLTAQKKTTSSSANSSGLKTVQRKAVSVIQKVAPEEEPKQAKSDGTIQKVEEIEMEEQPIGVTQQKKLQESPTNSNPAQRKENKTGMPDNLKSGIESLSGMSMDHVKVHYNSSQPAQLNALAYAQGSDIHIAPGQEKHLAHEAWHVVQQAQGRVQPTTQMKMGVAVNDDPGLEHEADVMGAKAAQLMVRQAQQSVAQRAKTPSTGGKKKGPKKKGAKKKATPVKYLNVKTVTVRNKIDDYSSGIISSVTRATGVEKGPRAEAQKVASILGGTWVGGHMVNDELGGGGGYSNIVPISSSMNGFHRTMENKARDFLFSSAGNSIEYKMKILNREDRVVGKRKVNNLPVKFQQTIVVHPQSGPTKTIKGSILTQS